MHAHTNCFVYFQQKTPAAHTDTDCMPSVCPYTYRYGLRVGRRTDQVIHTPVTDDERHRASMTNKFHHTKEGKCERMLRPSCSPHIPHIGTRPVPRLTPGVVLTPTITVSRTQRASFAKKYHRAARRPLAAAANIPTRTAPGGTCTFESAGAPDQAYHSGHGYVHRG